MSKYKSLPFLLLSIIVLLCFYGCRNMTTSDLIGKWQLIEVTEEEMPLGIDLINMNFNFYENDRYTYYGNLNYRESGMYRLNKNLLFTKDTTREESIEKAVRVFFKNDTLIFKMNENGTERLMKLIRANDN